MASCARVESLLDRPHPVGGKPVARQCRSTRAAAAADRAHVPPRLNSPDVPQAASDDVRCGGTLT
jgi:hypothetical protein